MKRIFKSTFPVLAAIALLASCTTSPKPEVGIQLYSLRDAMDEDPIATVQQLGPTGYDYVEAAGYSNGKFYGIDPEEFKQLVEESGMVFRGSHTGQAIPDSGSWKELMPWWDECIAAHKAAGVEYIVQPFMGGSGYESLEGLTAYCDYFNAVGAKCNEAGIRFGYHNHDREFDEIEDEVIYDYMIKHTDSEKVMFQMDVYWVSEGGADPIAYFEKYPDRFGSIHIKDETELGASGEIDFKVILDEAKEIGSKYFVVEVEEYNFEPIVSVEKSLEYLREIGFAR